MSSYSLIDVTPENVMIESLFCIRTISDEGFEKKREWFNNMYIKGLRLKILKNIQEKPTAFIEYLPAEEAWRPVEAPSYLFIHCMYVNSNKEKLSGNGSRLLAACEADAQTQGLSGVCVMASEGSWMANASLFLKNGYEIVDKRGRFELLAKKFTAEAKSPVLLDWTKQLSQYQGWNLIYANQCPWHSKAVKALSAVAAEYNIDLKIRELTSAADAKNAPSGFGVFSLVLNGKLLEDHYISETRFKNILKKELH